MDEQSLHENKLNEFDVIQTIYKHVGDHGIRADFLVPQTAPTGKRPVIVRFHGGGFVCFQLNEIS